MPTAHYLPVSGVEPQRFRCGTATVTTGDAGCTRTFSDVAVSIFAPCTVGSPRSLIAKADGEFASGHALYAGTGTLQVYVVSGE